MDGWGRGWVGAWMGGWVPGIGYQQVVADTWHLIPKEISDKESTPWRGKASGQKLLEQSRQFPPRSLTLTANAQYSVHSFLETT